MRVYLLRHGETPWNSQRRIQGQADVPLNENGIRQAQQWREFFDRLHLEGVYSSLLSRAMQTAQLATGRPPCLLHEMNERHFGDWQGQVWTDLESQVPSFHESWRQPDFCPPGGESRIALHDRVTSLLPALESEHAPDSGVLIVGHGGSAKAIIAHARNCSVADAPNIPTLGNASLVVLSVEHGRWEMVDSIPGDSTMSRVFFE